MVSAPKHHMQLVTLAPLAAAGRGPGQAGARWGRGALPAGCSVFGLGREWGGSALILMGFRRAQPFPWPPVFCWVNQAPPPRPGSVHQKWPWCPALAVPEAESCGELGTRAVARGAGGGGGRGRLLSSWSFLRARPELRTCPHFAQPWGPRKDPESVSDQRRARRHDSRTQEAPRKTREILGKAAG